MLSSPSHFSFCHRKKFLPYTTLLIIMPIHTFFLMVNIRQQKEIICRKMVINANSGKYRNEYI